MECPDRSSRPPPPGQFVSVLLGPSSFTREVSSQQKGRLSQKAGDIRQRRAALAAGLGLRNVRLYGEGVYVFDNLFAINVSHNGSQ